MREANQAMRRAAELQDPATAVIADESFHEVWIERANNGELSALLGQFRTKLRRVELAYFDAAARALSSFREHAAIIRALSGRSLPAAPGGSPQLARKCSAVAGSRARGIREERLTYRERSMNSLRTFIRPVFCMLALGQPDATGRHFGGGQAGRTCCQGRSFAIARRDGQGDRAGQTGCRFPTRTASAGRGAQRHLSLHCKGRTGRFVRPLLRNP